jgi:hypothetical protein
MRIEQLIGESDLDEARAGGALSTRAASNAAGKTIGKNMAAGMPSADANNAINQAKAINPNTPVGAGQPNLSNRLAQFKANKAATTPTTVQQQAPDIGNVSPGNDLTTTNGTVTQTQQTQEPKQSLAQRAGGTLQNVSNVIQKGAANASQNIPGIANWAGDLAQNTAPGINKVTGAVGNVLNKTGQAVNTAAKGLTKGVQGVGDLAGATAGAISQPVGQFAGGFKRGFQKATGTFPQQGGGQQSQAPQGGGQQQNTVSRGLSALGGGGGNAGAGDKELADIEARLQKLEQLMKVRA